MARRSPDGSETIALGIVAASLIIAALVVAVVAIVLVSMIKELWRIFHTHAFQSGPASRILWGSLAGLLGLWLVSGVLATQPHTVRLSPIIASWSIFVFVIICECTDRRFRQPAPQIPKQIALADVVSWHPQASPVMANASGNGR